MKLALVGLLGSGKTTLFNVLTGANVPVAQFDVKPNLSEIRVPDDRLDKLSAIFKPKKTTPAMVRITDLPGILPGETTAERLALVREADALVHVVRAFDSATYPHPLSRIDPAADRVLLDLEMASADQAIVEKRAEKLRHSKGKTRFTPENAAELDAIEAVLAPLIAKKSLAGVELPDAAWAQLRSFALLMKKPQLIAVNLDERALEQRFFPGDPAVLHLPAKLEADLLTLDVAERAMFMEEMGLKAYTRDELIRRAYDLLGLHVFFTVGEDECRAWTIPKGADAVEAAACIHTDLARGFIRAEVVSYADFSRLGSMAKAREAGRFRLEGKEYVVQDGDIVHVRSGV